MMSAAKSIKISGLGVLVMFGWIAGAEAMPMPALTQSEHTDVIRVSGHDHHHDRNCHSGHRYHGNDRYYQNDDDSGVLFKSFVTGTLFNRSAREAPQNGE